MQNKGFTLIEMMVAVAVFTLLISASSGIFISSLRAQKHGLATQEVLDQTSYVIEYMSRAIRMARKDLLGECISVKLNYEETRAGKGLAFKNYRDECQEFFWDTNTNQLKEIKAGSENYLTSASLTVENFSIELIGEQQTDNLQPKVTIFLDISGKEQSNIKIQTTISQRNLDVMQ